MNKQRTTIPKVPCNIITGFLGVGKTTAILNLLKNKPKHERWAVLVNEFGEIGIDGALIKGQQTDADSVFIKELPGGCMCCTNGLPMQMALNQLIARSKPDRLLIEPTGLGHPVEVLETLSNQFNRDVIDIQQTLTLVDARKLDDPRYKKHETFIQQLCIADRIIANKSDLYKKNEHQGLAEYLGSLGLGSVPVEVSNHAKIDTKWLVGATDFQNKKAETNLKNDSPGAYKSVHKHTHQHEKAEKLTTQEMSQKTLQESQTRKAENQGEGFESVGWTIPPTQVFSYAGLQSFFNELKVERMKAVFITDEGIFGFNLADELLSVFELHEAYESRIEIICEQRNPDWETSLFKALSQGFESREC